MKTKYVMPCRLAHDTLDNRAKALFGFPVKVFYLKPDGSESELEKKVRFSNIEEVKIPWYAEKVFWCTSGDQMTLQVELSSEELSGICNQKFFYLQKLTSSLGTSLSITRQT
jgi:hypothetical protein